ncbi:hypothetical protein QYE76_013972 [Lolium multiflorum]|uniref:Uncharacterized protein n=1 Tax=Lolium multiflorum TaxID=4521 RepID=A0AAD8U432_LOLMU|nr:hypothetical protein QYE76_013972 [Lolium multiflorum]
METRSRSRSKDTREATPRDRLRHDGKRYVTEGEVKNIRYRPLSDHLLNKYVSQYSQHRRSSNDDDRDRLAGEARRHRWHDRGEEEYERRAKEKLREQDDEDRHWDCPFFRHCWDSGMSRLPTIGNCPECNQKKKEAANVSVFKRLGPLPPQSKRAESPRMEDLEDSEDEGEEEEDRSYLRAVAALVAALSALLPAGSSALLRAAGRPRCPHPPRRAAVCRCRSLRFPGQGANRLGRLVERSLSPSVKDLSSSHWTEKSWLDSSPASMARRVFAAWTSFWFGSGVGSREEEDWVERSDETEEEEDMVAQEGFWSANAKGMRKQTVWSG